MSGPDSNSTDSPVTVVAHGNFTLTSTSSLTTKRVRFSHMFRLATSVTKHRGSKNQGTREETSPLRHFSNRILKKIVEDPCLSFKDLSNLCLVTYLSPFAYAALYPHMLSLSFSTLPSFTSSGVGGDRYHVGGKIYTIRKALEAVPLCARSVPGELHLLPRTLTIDIAESLLEHELHSWHGLNTNQDKFGVRDVVNAIARKLRLQQERTTGEALLHGALRNLPNLIHLALHTAWRERRLRLPDHPTNSIFEGCSFADLETWTTNMVVTAPMLSFTLKLRSLRKLCFHGICIYRDTPREKCDLHRKFKFELGSEDSAFPSLRSFGYSRSIYPELVQAITEGRSIDELLLFATHSDVLFEQISNKYISLDTRKNIRTIELYRERFVPEDIKVIAALFPSLRVLKVYVCEEASYCEWSRAEVMDHLLDSGESSDQNLVLGRINFEVKYSPTLLPNQELESEKRATMDSFEVIEVFCGNDDSDYDMTNTDSEEGSY